MHQTQLRIRTEGRGLYEITSRIKGEVAHSGVETGLCHVFIHHTSASLIICENADPTVVSDLERFIARLVPDGDPLYEHTLEGPDDMPAHVRSVLTQSALAVPVVGGRLALGTWQGVFVWEHRLLGSDRRITITTQGA